MGVRRRADRAPRKLLKRKREREPRERKTGPSTPWPWAGVAAAYSPRYGVLRQPSTGVTIGHALRDLPRIAVTRTTGITITPSAPGRGAPRRPATWITSPGAHRPGRVPAGRLSSPASPPRGQVRAAPERTWTDVTATCTRRTRCKISEMGRPTGVHPSAPRPYPGPTSTARFTPKELLRLHYHRSRPNGADPAVLSSHSVPSPPTPATGSAAGTDWPPNGTRPRVATSTATSPPPDLAADFAADHDPWHAYRATLGPGPACRTTATGRWKTAPGQPG